MRAFLANRGVSLSRLVGALAVLAATVLVSRWHWHDPNAAREARLVTIESHVAQAEAGWVLLVGDSTAERWHLPELCGLPVVNVGVGRAKAADILGPTLDWKARVKPSLVIASIGNNDDDPESAARAFSEAVGASYLVPISFGERPDGKHLTARDYAMLTETVRAEVC